MAACGSFKQIFENPLPENNPSLIDSLSSRNQFKPVKSINHSFNEIFGELHFKETPSSSSSSLPLTDSNQEPEIGSRHESQPASMFSGKPGSGYVGRHRSSDNFSSLKTESLKLCTEGLGFESLDDVEDSKEVSDCSSDWENMKMERVCVRDNWETAGDYLCPDQYKTARSCGRTSPPPISCIGRGGMSWGLESYRKDGRFVLQEVSIPTHEFLHSCREDGRLRLCFAQPHNHLLNHQKTAAAEEAAEEGRDLEDSEREEEEDGEDGEDGEEAFIE
ncbi:hypothetical protein Nepgr_009175 [Nepenthes gracilis]|uniref:FAF domain-containing protein n=1 Tax=Nepenthes gracilis TaxID=150966 RepID=A0AAD3XK44_NEPGR|nr:hypothetical protein Nepgr_009175 [Nepenthes gracilis]